MLHFLPVNLCHWSVLLARVIEDVWRGCICKLPNLIACRWCTLATAESRYSLDWIEFIIVVLVHNYLLGAKVNWNRVLQVWLMLNLSGRVDRVEFAVLLWMCCQSCSMWKFNFIGRGSAVRVLLTEDTIMYCHYFRVSRLFYFVLNCLVAVHLENIACFHYLGALAMHMRALDSWSSSYFFGIFKNPLLRMHANFIPATPRTDHGRGSAWHSHEIICVSWWRIQGNSLCLNCWITCSRRSLIHWNDNPVVWIESLLDWSLLAFCVF